MLARAMKLSVGPRENTGLRGVLPGVSSPGVKLFATALAALQLVLLPLAYGSPVDPSLPGFWDDDDYDNVILFLTSELDLLATAHRLVVQAFATVAGSVFEHPPWVVTPHAYAPGTPRAPPASGEVA